MTTPLDQTRAMDEAREAFEADYFGNLPMTSEARSRNGDGYHFSLPQTAWATWWTAWQAAIASMANGLPIATAPKDGTRILLLNHGHWITVQWQGAETNAPESWPTGWRGGIFVVRPEDAHTWHPLPPTPQDPPIAALAAKETT